MVQREDKNPGIFMDKDIQCQDQDQDVEFYSLLAPALQR